MTPHDHTTLVPGCYRCELGRDEAFDLLVEERDEYRQAALELHSEIRSALAWKASGCEPAVADHMLLKAADKWLHLLEDED